jgi:hypothetical protein
MWSWHSADPEAATGWVESLPSGRLRDNTLVALATNVHSSDLSESWAWAERIEDSELRDAQLERLAREWLSYEPETARGVIDGSSLPDEIRDGLLNPTNRCECATEVAVQGGDDAGSEDLGDA